MRDGQFEMIVLGDREYPFNEEVIDQKPFIAAEPKESYHVKINVYRDRTGKFPAKYLRLGMYVDGNDVQYWKRLDLSDDKLLPKDYSLPISSVFWGFKKNTSEIRSFVFSKPGLSSASPSSSLFESEMGTIKLVVHEARLQSGVFNNNCGIHETPSNVNLNGDQKFWQQPSVVTSSGKKIESEREKFVPLMRWENASEVPLKTMILYYHSKDMLKFLKTPQIQLKRSHDELDSTGGGGSDENNKKKTKFEDSSLDNNNSKNDNNGDVEEIVREKSVPLLDLTEETPKWESMTVRK